MQQGSKNTRLLIMGAKSSKEILKRVGKTIAMKQKREYVKGSKDLIYKVCKRGSTNYAIRYERNVAFN